MNNFIKIFLQELKTKYFPTINVNIFCNEERLIIEIDKYEIFYYSIETKKFKYKHIDQEKAELIKGIYIFCTGGDLNG
jgi:hypothetical protein